jgi:L-asparaginase
MSAPGRAPATRPRLVVLATGGTIAAATDPATGAARPAITGADLVAALPGAAAIAEVRVEQVANVASQELSLPCLLDIGRRAERLLDGGQADGIVITQGTMTMEESAYLWQLTLGPDRGPVVVTGAMRHTSLPGSDGPRNLLDALTAAADPATRQLGVVVCLNGELHAAREVVKTHTLNVDAFKSPDLGPLAFVRHGRVVVHRRPLALERLPGVRGAGAHVPLVPVGAGDDGRLIDAAAAGADGLVLAVMGGGAVPPACLPAIAAAAARMPVVAVSRCGAGAMYEDVYAAAGGDRDLRAAGVIFGGSLTGPKARVKLILALDVAGGDRTVIAAAFPNV